MSSTLSQTAFGQLGPVPEFMDGADIPSVTRATANGADVMVATAAINVLSLAMPVVILQVYDRVIPNQASATLTVFVLGLACVLLLDAGLGLLRAYLSGWSAARLQHILSTIAVGRMLGAAVQEVESVAPGIQLQRLRAIEIVKNFYAGQAVLIAIDLPFVLLFLGLIALIAGELALFPAGILVITAVIAVISGRRLRGALEERSIMDDRRHNFIIEVLSKILTVKALGLEPLLVRRHERLQGSSAEFTYWVTYFSSMARSIGGIFSQLTMVAVAAYGSTMVIDGTLSVGALAACTFLAGRSAQPMLRAFGLWTQFQGVKLGREQVEATLALPQERGEQMAEIGRLNGRVELQDVTFGYGENPREILSGINLVVEPGEVVGVTGANGCGKSTLLHMVTGLLTPSGGRVVLDGKEPRNFDPRSVRSQICYIPQLGALFHGTILDNLTMFRGDEFIDEAILQAERLGLNDVIARLPNGYETVVGDGSNDGLPGGVKQRIAIARALAQNSDPPLILFDEANSSLDFDSDERLKAVLEGFRGRCSMILVSHRPSILKLADRVYVLRDGGLHPAGGSGARAAQLRLGREYGT